VGSRSRVTYPLHRARVRQKKPAGLRGTDLRVRARIMAFRNLAGRDSARTERTTDGLRFVLRCSRRRATVRVASLAAKRNERAYRRDRASSLLQKLPAAAGRAPAGRTILERLRRFDALLIFVGRQLPRLSRHSNAPLRLLPPPSRDVIARTQRRLFDAFPPPRIIPTNTRLLPRTVQLVISFRYACR